MKKDFEFEEIDDEEKRILLSAFSYYVDKDTGEIWDPLLNEKVTSKYTGKILNLNNVGLATGSLYLMDSDPITISRYIREELEDESR